MNCSTKGAVLRKEPHNKSTKTPQTFNEELASKVQKSPHKKWSFPFRISLANVTKSAGNCGFGHIYWKNP